MTCTSSWILSTFRTAPHRPAKNPGLVRSVWRSSASCIRIIYNIIFIWSDRRTGAAALCTLTSSRADVHDIVIYHRTTRRSRQIQNSNGIIFSTPPRRTTRRNEFRWLLQNLRNRDQYRMSTRVYTCYYDVMTCKRIRDEYPCDVPPPPPSPRSTSRCYNNILENAGSVRDTTNYKKRVANVCT